MKLSLLLLLTLVACSSTGPIDQKKRAEINDIGMVSVVPAESNLLYMGTTIFENKQDIFLTDSWDLAGQMQQEFTARLKEHGKTVKALKFKEIPPLTMREYEDNEIQKLFPEAKAQGAKYLFVVSPTRHGSIPFSEGVGLYCRSALGMKGSWNATYQVFVALWDLSTSQKIYQTAFLPDDGLYDSKQPCANWKKSETQKFAEGFKVQMQGLAKKAALKALQYSELIPGRPKSLSL